MRVGGEGRGALEKTKWINMWQPWKCRTVQEKCTMINSKRTPYFRMSPYRDTKPLTTLGTFTTEITAIDTGIK